jgi:hypothetical protein
MNMEERSVSAGRTAMCPWRSEAETSAGVTPVIRTKCSYPGTERELIEEDASAERDEQVIHEREGLRLDGVTEGNHRRDLTGGGLVMCWLQW